MQHLHNKTTHNDTQHMNSLCLFLVSFMLIVANKLFTLTVIILNCMAPNFCEVGIHVLSLVEPYFINALACWTINKNRILFCKSNFKNFHFRHKQNVTQYNDTHKTIKNAAYA